MTRVVSRLGSILLCALPVPPLAAFDRDPALVGRLGGAELTAVVVEGDLAFCGADVGLLILDVGSAPGDPLNVEPVGTWEGAAIRDFAVSDGLVYAGSGDSLVVIDVSDPARPRELGRFDGGLAVRALALTGDQVVMVIFGDVLHAIDVSDSAAPRQVTQVAVGGRNIRDVDVSGNLAYVADEASSGPDEAFSGGLRIFDIRVPAEPQRVGFLSIDYARNVVVADGFAYVGSLRGFCAIVDVRNPTEPREIRRVAGGGPVFGNYLFTSNRVYDISRPEELYVAGFLDRSGRLFVANGRAYAAGASGLEVFELPEFGPLPELVGVLEGVAAGTQIFLAESHAYVRNDVGFYVVDVTDPASPQPVGMPFELPGRIVDNIITAVPKDIFVAGDHAYVAAGNGGLRIIDVSNPAGPEQIAMVDTGGEARYVWVAGDHAYVAAFGRFSRRLMVIDVSDPREPELVGEAPTFGRVVVADGFAYLGGDRGDIIDVRDPRNPVTVGYLASALDGTAMVTTAGLFASGDFVYLADEGLLVVDVSDPARPRLTGSLDLAPRTTGKVIVSGNRAYLSGPDGINVIDVSDPSEPRLIDRYLLLGQGTWNASDGLVYGLTSNLGLYVIDTSVPPTPAVTPVRRLETSVAIEDAAIAGSHAYVVDPDAGLSVFDIADPATPRRVAREPSARGDRVFVSGSGAYVIRQDRQQEPVRTVIDAVDISDPHTPRVAGRYAAGSYRELSMASGHAYLLEQVFDVQPPAVRIEVVDVGDPAVLRQVGEYVTTGPSHGLFVQGRYAYLGVRSDNNVVELEVIDLSDPARPQLLSRRELPVGLPVVFSGERAYAAYRGAVRLEGFEAFDVSAPVDPKFLGRYAGRTGGPLAVSGELVYSETLPDFLEEGFHLLDVSDPTRPQLVARRPDSTLKAVSGSLALTREGSRGLHILDVSRPANPQRVGAFDELGDTAGQGGIALAGELAYVTNGDGGLVVIGVSDPSAPTRVGEYETTGTTEGVFVVGGIAYVADGFDGLEVVDVSDPASPRQLGEIRVIGEQGAGYANDVFVAGDEAYVASQTSSSTGSLEVIDVSDPTSPQRLERLPTAFGAAEFVFVSGGHAFVSSREVEVFDVSSPSRPRRVAALPEPTGRRGTPAYGDVFVAADRAYVAGDGLLLIYALRNPASPALLGTHPLSRGAGVHVSGGYAYVVDRRLGLEVIDVSDPAAPRRVGGNSAVLRSRKDGGGLAVATENGRVFVNAGGDGLSVLELRAPFPPTNVSAQTVDGETEISWSAPPGGLAPTGYDVFRVSPGPRQRVNTEPVAATAFTVHGLVLETEHCFVVQALSSSGESSIDSAPPACVAATPRFLRGDGNDDGILDIADPIANLGFQFTGTFAPPCRDALDFDDNGLIDLSDPIASLTHQFLGGPAPAPPGKESCGPDPTGDELSCERYICR